MKKVFITGTSSGLGLGFCEIFLKNDYLVFSMSRSSPPTAILNNPHTSHISTDLSADPASIQQNLAKLFPKPMTIDLVILNAGILGRIDLMQNTPLPESQEVMSVNVWANKIILDWFINHNFKIKQVIAISSGASLKANKGWGSYALSKATLNALIKLYANEMPDTHLLALAPGLVDSKMQDYMYDKVDEKKFPSVTVLKNARNTPDMPQPLEAATNIFNRLDDLIQLPSGSYSDIRKI